jgi:Fic family protein
MKENYTPPFSIGSKTLNLVAEICEMIGELAHGERASELLRLRRINQLKTVQGSLAIEGNTLSIDQITAVLAGKKVRAPKQEILEVRNAMAVYDRLNEFNAFSLNDLLRAHSMLMRDIIDSAGRFRQGGAGVMAGEKIIHVAPPAKRVPELISNLLGWAGFADEHPLILSTVFHYEFEFIHPFADGNGRMGRLWQTLILSKWQPVLTMIPVESLIFENQQEYYDTLALSTKKTDCRPFVDFMLRIILAAIKERAFSEVTPEVAPEVTPEVTPEVAKMLRLLRQPLSRREIMSRLGLSDEKHFRESYLHAAMAAGLVEMTVPDKPRSRLQRYRLTEAGRRFF